MGLTDIARRSRAGTVVVVSHDAVNRQLLVAFDVGARGFRHAPARQRVLQHARVATRQVDRPECQRTPCRTVALPQPGESGSAPNGDPAYA